MFADLMHGILCIPLFSFIFLCAAYICKLYVLISFLRRHIKSFSQFKTSLTFISLFLIHLLFQDGSILIQFLQQPADSTLLTTLPFEFSLHTHIIIDCILSIIAYSLIFVSALILSISKKRKQKIELPRIMQLQWQLIVRRFIPIFLLYTASYTFFCYVLYARNLAILPILQLHSLITLLLGISPIYLAKKLQQLRLLNADTVLTNNNNDSTFSPSFMGIIEQLQSVTTASELTHVCKTFFNTLFAIPLARTHVFIRQGQETPYVKGIDHYDVERISSIVESWLKGQNKELTTLLQHKKALFIEDIEYAYYYNQDEETKRILFFLNHINADFFIPIFDNNKLIGYIIVEQLARPKQLYTKKERDTMLLFTSYVSQKISAIIHSSMLPLTYEHKNLVDELHMKQQEINHYKETLRTFIRTNHQRMIGLLYYRNKQFIMGNEAAQEILKIDVNTQLGHSLTQQVRKTAQQAHLYKTPQTITAQDNEGRPLIISAMPSLESSSIICFVYYREISDLINHYIEHFKDPAAWDHLLHLETTQLGQSINTLIPAHTEKLVQAKLKLFEIANTNKIALLNIPDDDLEVIANLLYKQSNRSVLHILTLTKPEKSDEIAQQLFGNHSTSNKKHEHPLLESLNSNGFLCIKNIEYLQKDTQQKLAHYCRTGYFYQGNNEKIVASDVRIICSSSKPLANQTMSRGINHTYIQDIFAQELWAELHHNIFILPALSTLSHDELNALIDGYSALVLKDTAFNKALTLTEHEKKSIAKNLPTSLQALRRDIAHIMKEKSAKYQLSDEITEDTHNSSNDPDIHAIIKLGKKALKNQTALTILWNKYKNQTKIAELLGVNRSSVHRRCHEYNLK